MMGRVRALVASATERYTVDAAAVTARLQAPFDWRLGSRLAPLFKLAREGLINGLSMPLQASPPPPPGDLALGTLPVGKTITVEPGQVIQN
jgi:hypothetical protein